MHILSYKVQGRVESGARLQGSQGESWGTFTVGIFFKTTRLKTILFRNKCVALWIYDWSYSLLSDLSWQTYIKGRGTIINGALKSHSHPENIFTLQTQASTCSIGFLSDRTTQRWTWQEMCFYHYVLCILDKSEKCFGTSLSALHNLFPIILAK